MPRTTLAARYRGALLGLACGDAVGTTVEFLPRGSFSPVVDMVGGGPFHLKPGQWTDDTSMALCLAESLLYVGGFDAKDQMNRYCNWWQHGYLSSTGECFDIGNATRAALSQYLETHDPFAGSMEPTSGGNGSLMRLAPVVLFFLNDPACLHHAEVSSRTTHAALEPVECCRLLAQLLIAILRGAPRDELLSQVGDGIREPAVRTIVGRHYASLREADVRGSGYCIEVMAYQFQKYGMLEGKVRTVSADSSSLRSEQAAAEGAPSAPTLNFKAIVELQDQRLIAGDLQLPLAAGMQLSAEILQGERTVLAYLLSPVQRVVSEAATER